MSGGGYSYEWNAEGTDADLVYYGKEKEVQGQTWVYPSNSQCNICHTSFAGKALGPEHLQVNGDFTYPGSLVTDNQLLTLDHINIFSDCYILFLVVI